TPLVASREDGADVALVVSDDACDPGDDARSVGVQYQQRVGGACEAHVEAVDARHLNEAAPKARALERQLFGAGADLDTHAVGVDVAKVAGRELELEAGS